LVESDNPQDRVAGTHVETVALHRNTVCGFTATGFRVGHDHGHLDHRPMRWRLSTAAQVDERFGQQLLPRRHGVFTVESFPEFTVGDRVQRVGHRRSKRSDEFTVDQDPVGGVADRQFRSATFLVRVMRPVLVQQVHQRTQMTFELGERRVPRDGDQLFLRLHQRRRHARVTEAQHGFQVFQRELTGLDRGTQHRKLEVIAVAALTRCTHSTRGRDNRFDIHVAVT
jgi:hypothetical protein